jgi:hypothetical protein
LKPKTPIWVNFRGSCNGRCLVYFTAIWYISYPFGIFNGYLVYFSPFWLYVAPRKSWQPWQPLHLDKFFSSWPKHFSLSLSDDIIRLLS